MGQRSPALDSYPVRFGADVVRFGTFWALRQEDARFRYFLMEGKSNPYSFNYA